MNTSDESTNAIHNPALLAGSVGGGLNLPGSTSSHTSSLSSDSQGAATKKGYKPNASRRLVRKNYRLKVLITYAEAADFAGVNVRTVENWISAGRLPRAAKVGPYRVDFEKLQKFLKTGRPPT